MATLLSGSPLNQILVLCVQIFSSLIQILVFGIMVFVFFQTMRQNFRKDIADRIATYNTRISNLRLDDRIKSKKLPNNSAEKDIKLENFCGDRAIGYYFNKFAYLVLQIRTSFSDNDLDPYMLKTLSKRFFTYYDELKVIYEGIVQIMFYIEKSKVFMRFEKTRMFEDIRACLSSFETGILALYIFQHSESKALEKIFNCYGFEKSVDEDFIQFSGSGPFGSHILPPPNDAYNFILLNKQCWHKEKAVCEPEISKLMSFFYNVFRNLYTKEEYARIFGR